MVFLLVRFLSVQRRRCRPVVATGRVCCGSSSRRWYGLHAVDVQAVGAKERAKRKNSERSRENMQRIRARALVRAGGRVKDTVVAAKRAADGVEAAPSLLRSLRAASSKSESDSLASTSQSPSPSPASIPLRSKTSDGSITVAGQAFMNDTRSTCGVGLGDGISNHTAKWHAAGEAAGRTPIEYCQAAEPIRVHGLSVACTGVDGEDGYSLGGPVQFISLKGTSRQAPAVCKYTGRKYYSEDWRGGGGGH